MSKFDSGYFQGDRSTSEARAGDDHRQREERERAREEQSRRHREQLEADAAYERAQQERIWEESARRQRESNELERKGEAQQQREAHRQRSDDVAKAKSKTLPAPAAGSRASTSTIKSDKRSSAAALSGIIGMIVVCMTIAAVQPNAGPGLYAAGALTGCLVFGLLYRFLLGAAIGAMVTSVALTAMFPDLSDKILLTAVAILSFCAGLAHRLVISGTKATGRILLFIMKSIFVIGFIMLIATSLLR